VRTVSGVTVAGPSTAGPLDSVVVWASSSVMSPP
jgi:hypothetical protein